MFPSTYHVCVSSYLIRGFNEKLINNNIILWFKIYFKNITKYYSIMVKVSDKS